MEENLPLDNNSFIENRQTILKEKLTLLQHELGEIQQKTYEFEAVLRSHLENEIVEEQELFVLYKKVQKAKKLKRLAQKNKGKKTVEGILVIKKIVSENIVEDQKELKRLYREAMLQSHPDKYSLHEDKVDLATEITTKLIEIYQSGDLEKLRDFHAHICSGNALSSIDLFDVTAKIKYDDVYLQKEIIAVEKQLAEAKNKYTYQVLITYKNPLTYIFELKEFYDDRIFKLKKRTRNSHKFEL
ncbi:MAG: hypothetical protein KBE41_12265 [Lutibacter sp.]|nr:hypothetical protein [Lutibacter sp.]